MPQSAIIVAGHAVLRTFADPSDRRNWALLDFQQNEVPCYIEHVRRGVELAASDPDAILLPAGGQSRRQAGPRSEALSYYYVAEHYGWFGNPEVAARTYLEEFSRDSYENLLLGLCRFHEVTAAWPRQVTLVSWEFKRERFQMHREAIGWPAERFLYEGPNNPPDLEQAHASEIRARERYQADPYSSDPEFAGKRAARNPFRREHGYRTSCPDLVPLFAHEGPGPYRGTLPWQRKRLS
ncbi:MAG: hypothetical protein IT168_07205 [Bryobacterales bacterium]|nr:hypothetical protein [Bryobacterales bacterium]